MNAPSPRPVQHMRQKSSVDLRHFPHPGRSFRFIWMIPVLLGMGHSSLAAPVELGRLFYTPAQRAQLESARTHNIAQRAGQNPRGSPDDATAPLRFDGMVIRSDGKTTRWVDGKPRLDGSGMSDLKPGQIRANGKVYEPYQVLRPISSGPTEPGAKEPTP